MTTRRALQVPVVEPYGDWVIDKWTEILRKDPSAPPLRLAQASVCEALSEHRFGVFGSFGVGVGKTLITLIAPKATSCERPVVMVPTGLSKRMPRIHAEWAKTYDVADPTFVEYSALSSKKHRNILDDLRPDLLILDEAHYAKNMTAARTKRLFRYILSQGGNVRVVAISGTLSSGRLDDFAHLAAWSLMDDCPVPIRRDHVEDWASVLDTNGIPHTRAVSRARQLCAWAGTDDVERAFQKRLWSAPGAIVFRGSECGASLRLDVDKRRPPAAVTKALNTLVSDWTLPNGVEVVDAPYFAQQARNISVGFYYEWSEEPPAAWMSARADWGRRERNILQYRSREGLDSGLLVREATSRGEMSSADNASLKLWMDIKDTYRPKTRPVWISDFAVKRAVAWAKSNKGGLVWIQSKAMHEALTNAGFDVRGQGDDAPFERQDQPLALKMRVFGTGHDLYMFHKNYVIEPSPGGTTNEQMIGRTHRSSQREGTVEVTYAQWTAQQAACLQKAKRTALKIGLHLDTPQRLTFGDWVSDIDVEADAFWDKMLGTDK